MAAVNFKYGLEIEWADFDNRRAPPEGWTHSELELSIVNSDGTATIPGVNPKGGEINSPVFDDVHQLLESVDKLIATFPDASVNHREALHIHLSCPEFSNHEVLRSMAIWFNTTIPSVLNYMYPVIDRARYWSPTVSRRVRWWENWQYQLLERSTSYEDFLDCFHKTRDGRVYAGPPRRYAVNFSSLKKHGTIEFRLFPATLERDRIVNAVLLCENLVRHAAEGEKLLPFKQMKLPEVPNFSPALEEGWRKTNAHGRDN